MFVITLCLQDRLLIWWPWGGWPCWLVWAGRRVGWSRGQAAAVQSCQSKHYWVAAIVHLPAPFLLSVNIYWVAIVCQHQNPWGEADMILTLREFIVSWETQMHTTLWFWAVIKGFIVGSHIPAVSNPVGVHKGRLPREAVWCQELKAD